MALGKITIVLGAGIIGSILTKDTSLPGISDIFSGAWKGITTVAKYAQQDRDKTKSSNSNRHTEYLLSQVNNLREELQMMASSKPVTIVTGATRSRTGTRITVIVIVGVIGYGIIRLKGWKLSDMMFVTKRGLADASAAVGKQLELVQASVTAAKNFLASRIDRVDCSLDECKEKTAETNEQIMAIHGDLSAFHKEMQSVSQVVQDLGSKLGRIEASQDYTFEGIYDLCQFAKQLEQKGNADVLQVSPPIPAIESSKKSPVLRSLSLPVSVEPPSPTSAQSRVIEAPKVFRTSTTMSPSALQELRGVTNGTNGFARSNSIKVGSSGATNGVPSSAEPSNGTPNSSSSRFNVRIPGLPIIGALTRLRNSTS